MDECVAIARQDQLLHRLVELDGPVEGDVLPIPQLPAYSVPQRLPVQDEILIEHSGDGNP